MEALWTSPEPSSRSVIIKFHPYIERGKMLKVNEFPMQPEVHFSYDERYGIAFKLHDTLEEAFPMIIVIANKELQKDYNVFGRSSFHFEVVQEVKKSMFFTLNILEKEWIRKFENPYNAMREIGFSQPQSKRLANYINCNFPSDKYDDVQGLFFWRMTPSKAKERIAEKYGVVLTEKQILVAIGRE